MIDKDGSSYRVTVPMLIANARALLEAGRGLLRVEQEKSIVIDLSSVRDIDSSALAVFFAWQRSAAERGLALRLAGTPASLLSLADLYGVDTSLPLV